MEELMNEFYNFIECHDPSQFRKKFNKTSFRRGSNNIANSLSLKKKETLQPPKMKEYVFKQKTP